jgi:hypothetical protein
MADALDRLTEAAEHVYRWREQQALDALALAFGPPRIIRISREEAELRWPSLSKAP